MKTKEKKHIDKPSKEIKIDKQEAEALKMLESQLSAINTNIGILRTDYVQKERMLIGEIARLSNQMTTQITLLKKKYHIVGQPERIDYMNNKIILK